MRQNSPVVIYRHMVHQSSELLLLLAQRHSAHPLNPWTPVPALCRTVLDCASFSLAAAFLRRLRRGLPLLSTASLVYARSDSCTRTRPPFGFAPSLTGLSGSQARCRSPVPCMLLSTCTGSSTTPRPASSRVCLPRMLPSTYANRVGTRSSVFGSIARPPMPLSTLAVRPRRTTQDSRSDESLLFSVGLFHPLQHAGYPGALASRIALPSLSQDQRLRRSPRY